MQREKNMGRKRRLVSTAIGLLVLAISSIWSLPMMAQSFYGGIAGTVTDATGAIVPGATVTVTNLGTNEVRTAQSGASGEYRFVDLLPAAYKIAIESKGFKRFEVQSMQVQVDNTLRVDARLEVGSATETVEVTTQTPLLQTESGSVGTEIEGQQVQAMPLNGRNPMNLIALAPGVVANSGAQGSASFNAGNRTQNGSWDSYQIGGGFNNENAEYIDGAPINVLGGSTVSLVMSQDAVQEFRVESSAPSAEFGRFGGGVIEMTTKSGANHFHGTVYEYVRNTILNANPFTNDYLHQPVAAFHQNQYGAAIGGPIKRDKAFFFFNWENFSLRQGSVVDTNVPGDGTHGTTNQRGGVFSKAIVDPAKKCAIQPNTPSPGLYTIPQSCFDATSKVMLNYFPLPNTTPTPAANFNYVSSPVIGDDTHQYNARVDYNLSANQRLFARYTQWVLQDIGQNGFNNANGFPTTYAATANTTYAAVVGDTYTINPTAVADVRLSYTREFFNNPGPGVGHTDMSQFGPAYAALAPQLSFTALPGLALGGGPDNIYNLNPISEVQQFHYDNYGLNGSFTKILGNHALKFGGEGVLRLQNGTGTSHNPAGFSTFSNSTTGDEVASFLLGEFTNDNVTTILQSTTFNYSYALFGIDTWKVNRNLTVNLGLRWELPGGLEEKKDRTTVMLPNVVDPNTGSAPTVVLVNSPLYPSRSEEPYHYMLFSPRVSFAQSLSGSAVFRGGYAINYLPPDLPPAVISSASPVNSFTTTSTNGPVPNFFQANPFPPPTGIIEPAGRAFNSKTLLGQVVSEPVPTNLYPYMQQWDLSFGKQWKGDWLTEISYVGEKGTHLLENVAYGLDQVPEQYVGTGTAPGPLQAMENSLIAGGASAASAQNTVLTYAKPLRPYSTLYTNVSNAAAYTGSSTYEALYLVLQKRFRSAGLLNANYTWDKILTDTDEPNTGNNETGGLAAPQDFYNHRSDKSLAAIEVPQRLIVSYVLNLPFGKGQRFANGVSGITDRLISGWSANGITTVQSGTPLTFTYSAGNILSKNLGSGTIRPNYVPGCNKTKPGSPFQKLISNTPYFNTSCFTYAGDFQFGNEPRVDPTLRNPYTQNYDFALVKKTTLRESVNLQFEAEAFNIFNRVQFTAGGSALGSGTFGVVSAGGSPRLVQLSLRLNF